MEIAGTVPAIFSDVSEYEITKQPMSIWEIEGNLRHVPFYDFLNENRSKMRDFDQFKCIYH